MRAGKTGAKGYRPQFQHKNRPPNRLAGQAGGDGSLAHSAVEDLTRPGGLGDARAGLTGSRWRMIPKSGNRFSEKIMRAQNVRDAL